MPEMSFGRSIRYRRTKLGLSQTRLGELVGRSGAAVRSWERDSSTPTDPSVLQALSAVLGIEKEVLFEKAGVDLPEVETSPTVEEVLGSLTPTEEEVRDDVPTLSNTDLAELAALDSVLDSDPAEPGNGDAVPGDSDNRSADVSEVDILPKEPVTVAVAPVTSESDAASPARHSVSFTSSAPRYLYTMPAPPVPEPTYMEDESQRQLYRIRNLATLVLTVGLIVLFVWAVGNGWSEFTSWWDDFISNLQL